MASMLSVGELQGHTERVWSLAWSPDGRSLASCSADRTVRLWTFDLTTDTTPVGPDDKTPTTSSNLSTGTTAGSRGTVGSSLVPSSHQPTTNWRCGGVLEDAHHRTIRCVSWSPDGKALAMASFDATTSIWARAGDAWEQVAVLEGHENEVKCVSWSPDGIHVATCGRDKSVWIWESLPGHEYECVDVKQGHQQDVKMVAWHPSGEQLVSCSYDDSIKAWSSDGDEWVCTQTLAGSATGGPGHDSTVWAVAFNREGDGLVSSSGDGTLKFWGASQPQMDDDGHGSVGNRGRPYWRHVTTISGYHDRSVFTVDWNKCGPEEWVVTGDGDNCVRIFSPADPGIIHSDVSMGLSINNNNNNNNNNNSVSTSWEQVCSHRAHDADVNCVRWHPHIPGLLATCGDDGVVRVWHVIKKHQG